MARYQVRIEGRPTASDPEGQMVTVLYEAENYHEAWVGARTVCRIGTLFKDDPRCKNPNTAREFFVPQTEEQYPIGPGAWTVRRIFAENTRKQGKKRMTIVSSAQLQDLLAGQKIKVSDKLATALNELLASAEGGGLKITVAQALRLGIDPQDDPPPGREQVA